MQYVIEEYRWEGNKYYHLADSKVFESDKEIKEREYNKDGSLFIIYKDEIQTTRRRTKK
jgi:hypothetical protein